MSKLLRVGLLAGFLLGSVAPFSSAVDPKAIQHAIDRGVQALRGMQAGNGTWPPDEEFGAATQTGATALAGLTLLECGASAEDKAVQRAAEIVRKASIHLTHNYSICLAIFFFDRLGDPRDIPLIESLTVRLLAGQTSTGGWNYFSPAVSEAEVRRLQALLDQRKELIGRNNPPKAGIVERTAKDLPKEIKQQLALLRRQGVTATMEGSDNSNTQFATLALWVAHRYGLPVQDALKRVESRFRSSQLADGGWGYFDPKARVRRRMAASTASMTCAGLLGLAVADAKVLETVHKRRPGGQPQRAAHMDPNIRKGLIALSTAIGKPVNDKAGRAARHASPIPQVGGRTYYFLWSLERVGVALDLKTIGKKDWYAWGAEILVANQQEDGAWRGYYGLCGADTCFALLFLKRANLAPDLSRQLTGRVQDPSEHLLKGEELHEGIALEKPSRLTSGIEDKNAKHSEDGRYPEAIAKNTEPRPITKPLPKAAAPDKPQPEPVTSDKPPSSPAERMAADLAQATGTRFALLLDTMRNGKGAIFTEALALAVPKLQSDRQQKVRGALAERLTRMTDKTLFAYLADEQLEIRIAAARACAAKGSKTLVPRLIPLVRDTRGGVAEAAHQALKQLSGKDFGPKPDAGREERVKAAREWLDWWNKQEGK
ncbi:MAG TPA: hypothetical protein VMG10_20355 [Gemmataceae bacterium]|nr:hypothetical protein [Gemmataceae bacterium]